MKNLSLLFASLFLYFSSFGTIGPITGDSSICAAGIGATVYSYIDTTLGGYWTTSDHSIAVVDSFYGDVYGLAAGLVTLTYTVGPDYVTKTITVKINNNFFIGANFKFI